MGIIHVAKAKNMIRCLVLSRQYCMKSTKYT